MLAVWPVSGPVHLAALFAWLAALVSTPALGIPWSLAGQSPASSFETRLDWQRRYTVQVDGAEGTPFTVRYVQVYVSDQGTRGSSGNDDVSFEAISPYEWDLLAPVTPLRYWRYSVVVSPRGGDDLSVRLIDRGPR